MPRLLLLTLLLLAALAPPAQAQLAPQVTATLVDEGTEGGRRTVRLDVAGTCGPSAPEGTTAMVIAKLKRMLPGKAEPVGAFRPGLQQLGDHDYVDGTTASFRYRITGGWSAVGIGVIECQAPMDFEAGRSAPSAPLRAPVRLDSWNVHTTSSTSPAVAPRGATTSSAAGATTRSTAR